MPELVHVINLVVRDDGSLRVCETYIPRGMDRREDWVGTDVLDALAEAHDRIAQVRDTMSAPIST